MGIITLLPHPSIDQYTSGYIAHHFRTPTVGNDPAILIILLSYPSESTLAYKHLTIHYTLTSSNYANSKYNLFPLCNTCYLRLLFQLPISTITDHSS